MRNSLWPRVAICLSAAAMLATLGLACGTDEDEQSPTAGPVLGQGLPPEARHPVADTVNQLQRAFANDDHGAICALLTPAAAHAAGKAAHGSASTCVPDIRRLFGLISEGGGWRHSGKPRVIDVEVEGSRAIATIALDARWQARVPLLRRQGQWRLNGLFGTTAGHEAQIVASSENASFPPSPPRRRIQATRKDGTPCPKLLDATYPLEGGGCEVRFSTGKVPLTILTPFGTFVLSRCVMNYRVRVDSSGRTWTDAFLAGGKIGEDACGDVNECGKLVPYTRLPWRGRIYRGPGGHFLHRVRMCLATCVGTFVGVFTVDLWRKDGTWRARPVAGGGTSGFRLDAPLSVDGQLKLAATDG